jgi:hypothetical protein
MNKVLEAAFRQAPHIKIGNISPPIRRCSATKWFVLSCESERESFSFALFVAVVAVLEPAERGKMAIARNWRKHASSRLTHSSGLCHVYKSCIRQTRSRLLCRAVLGLTEQINTLLPKLRKDVLAACGKTETEVAAKKPSRKKGAGKAKKGADASAAKGTLPELEAEAPTDKVAAPKEPAPDAAALRTQLIAELPSACARFAVKRNACARSSRSRPSYGAPTLTWFNTAAMSMPCSIA